jgi:hypothetical protein
MALQYRIREEKCMATSVAYRAAAALALLVVGVWFGFGFG